METINTVAIFFALLILIAVPYWWKTARHRREAAKNHARSVKAGLVEPVTLHPHIDLISCIGCASCVRICPEEVLGIVDGRARVINGVRCVGHSLCAEVCPVGAITMGFGTPRQGMEIPFYDENFETSLKDLFIIGELGGIGLIRNAFDQGIRAVRHIAAMPRNGRNGAYDIAIVGAGPAGLAAALTAQESGLKYTVCEQDDLGGSLLHYPRKKVILTQPADLPLHGKIRATEITKEELLELFTTIVSQFRLNMNLHCRIEGVAKSGNLFTLASPAGQIQAHHVVLALGRRGTPRKLGIPGETLPKVAYRLIEAETYSDNKILVIGGGDSAVEAAVALARQPGNVVTLSYRREEFVRLKEKNEERVRELMKARNFEVIFKSEVTEIRPENVVIRRQGDSDRVIANDFVFIFAGGELPAEFLKKIGVRLRTAEVEGVTA